MTELDNTVNQEVETNQELSLDERRAAREKDAGWYVIQTVPGRDERAYNNLCKKMNNPIIGDSIFDVKLLYVEKYVTKGGKSKKVNERKFPSYLFVKMIYSREIGYEIISTEDIRGFADAKGTKPFPLPKKDVQRLNLEKNEVEKTVDFVVGERVRLTNETFYGLDGEIISIDVEGKKAVVNITMFGRETPCNVDLTEIEKF